MAPLPRSLLVSISVIVMMIGPLNLLHVHGTQEQEPLVVEPIDDPELPPWGYHRGILPNPPKGGDLSLTYENASHYTQFVPVWGRPSPFYDLSSDLEGSWGQVFVDQLIRDNGMFPVVHMSFFGKNHTLVQHPSLPTSTLNSPAWRSEYIQSARDVVNASRPRYLSLGNEVNRWYEAHGSSPADDNGFQHFVSLYNEAYDAVKEISPETIVFCTFSREIVSNNREADMSVLELFDSDKMDLLILTTYPFSVAGINRVRDIPDNYYSSVFDHFADKPFGFSEVSWTSLTAFGGEIEQASFIRNVTSRLTIDQGLDLHLIGWNWLHDLGPGDATGLMDMNGTKRLALDAWMNNSEPRFRRDNRVIEVLEDFGTYSYSLGTTFYDPDPWDTLTYSIWNGTAYTNMTSSKVGAMINENNLDLTSMDNVTGSTQVRIQVEDWSGLSNWTLIQVNIENVNDPPALKNSLDDLVFSEGGSPFFDLSYYIWDTDDDFNTLTIEVLDSPGLNVSANLEASPYMVLFADEEDFNGETYVLMQVSDPQEEFVLLNLTVRILPINDPPVLSTPGEIIIEEDGMISYDLSTWVSDKDDDELFWNITSSEVDNVRITIDDGFLFIEPDTNWFGTFSLHLNVTDEDEYVTYNIPVTVTPINDAPLLIPLINLTINEDEIIYFDLSNLTPIDPDNDPLYWYLENKTNNIGSVAIPGNNTIRITPYLDAFGTGEFFIRVQDGRGGKTYSRFVINILPVNDAPFFMAPQDWEYDVELGQTKTIDLRFTPYLVEDVDDKLESLQILTDHGLAQIDGLVMNITIPSDTASDNISLLVWIRDPGGLDSEVHELVLNIVEGGGNQIGWVHVDNITWSNPNGDIQVLVDGEPGQTIWVVFTDLNGIKGSFKMEESVELPGHYSMFLSDPGWPDGEELFLHLSSRKNGPNDSGELPLAIKYSKGEDVGSEKDPNMVVFIIGIASVLILLALAGIFFISRKNKPTIDDFDYDSLLEE